MIQLPSCKIVGVFGPVSSGKTYLVTQWAESQKRICIFDVTGEFIDPKTSSPYNVYFRNVKAVWQELQDHPWYFRIVYEPGRDMNHDFRWILSALWHTQSDKQFVVDEFHEICPVNASPEDVKTMLRFARHDKLGFIGVSQRIADVHKLFTSSCRMTVLFHTSEARDLDAIRDRWGKEVEHKVLHLRPLIHDDVTDVTTQIPQCVVIERGRLARVYDFQSDTFTDGGQVEEVDDEGDEIIEEEVEIVDTSENDVDDPEGEAS
jgi:hypothetical protein